MNKSTYLIFGLFLIVLSQADPVAAMVCPEQKVTPDPSLRVYYVKELKQEGVSLPDKPIQNTWKYNISWKPAKNHLTSALVKTYTLKAYACPAHTYACTDARCNAEISGCYLGTSWVAVTADYGVAVSGVRLGTILKPGYPCD
jgi:hypothetical protein